VAWSNGISLLDLRGHRSRPATRGATLVSTIKDPSSALFVIVLVLVMLSRHRRYRLF
jgi:hypothetical protein